jgi:hypothetical protein
LKYSEQVNRFPARDAEGQHYEILERITFSREVQADGSLGESVMVNRRFDLRTGERVNHLGGDDFELDHSGDRLTALRREDNQQESR